jgi:hypothetical protein
VMSRITSARPGALAEILCRLAGLPRDDHQVYVAVYRLRLEMQVREISGIGIRPLADEQEIIIGASKSVCQPALAYLWPTTNHASYVVSTHGVPRTSAGHPPGHVYAQAPAGSHRAQGVGPVCEDGQPVMSETTPPMPHESGE